MASLMLGCLMAARADIAPPPYLVSLNRLESGRELVAYGKTDADINRGIEDIQLALGSGSAFAAYDLAFLHLRGLHLPEDKQRAVSLLELGAAQENSFVLRRYATELLYGDHLPADVGRATTLLRRSAQLGNAIAKIQLARLLQQSDNVTEQRQGERLLASLERGARNYAFGFYALERLFEAPQRSARADFERLVAVVDDEDRATIVVSVVAQRCFDAPFLMQPDLTLEILEAYVNPQNVEMVNSYAWMLSACKDPALRDGQRALALLTPLRDEIQDQGYVVDTLAAAYAAVGEFDAAVTTQRRAIELLDPDDPALPDAKTRLEGYEAGEAWFE